MNQFHTTCCLTLFTLWLDFIPLPHFHYENARLAWNSAKIVTPNEVTWSSATISALKAFEIAKLDQSKNCVPQRLKNCCPLLKNKARQPRKLSKQQATFDYEKSLKKPFHLKAPNGQQCLLDSFLCLKTNYSEYSGTESISCQNVIILLRPKTRIERTRRCTNYRNFPLVWFCVFLRVPIQIEKDERVWV